MASESDQVAMNEALRNMSPTELDQLRQYIADEVKRNKMKTATDYDIFGDRQDKPIKVSSKNTKNKRGDKVVAFRKQEEHGPKMRIKP